MKKNKANVRSPFYSADQLPEKNSTAKNMVFLVLAFFLLAVSVFSGYRHILQENITPVPTAISEKYVWVTGFPEVPEGLHIFTPEQLENDFPEIGALLAASSSQEPNSVISALQYNAGELQPVNLPPEVANIFFREIPINRADKNILTSLPGIGPVIAEKIVSRRNKHGPFRSKDELLNIAGIGPKKFAGLIDHITLD
jgi:competence ComEA-like helix-hairpin-helix protein